jgi:hypothetical protein
MSNVQFFVEPMTDDPSYECTREKGAPNIAGWDPKYYSPVCRTWFTDQKKAFETNPSAPRGIMTDLY